MDGYFDVEKLRAQIQLWMPDKDGDPCHDGERLAYNSVLQFIEASAKPKEACPSKDYLRLKEKIKRKVFETYGPDDPELTVSHSRLKTGSMPQGQRSRLISPSDKAQAFGLR